MATNDVLDLTETIGDCGRFQFFLAVAVHAATVSSAWGMMMMVFGMYNPGWICLDGANSDVSFPLNHSADVYSSSSASSSPGSYDNHLNETTRTVNCTAVSNCEKWAYKEGASTLVTEWNLVCDLAWVPSVLISIEMVGVLVGSYLNGHISDRFGRKTGLYGFVAFHGLSHLVASFSVSWQMCAAVYFFIGIGVGGILISTFPYPLEFLNAWWRGIFSGIPFWPISYTSFAVVVYFLRDWRHIHISTAVLSLLIFLLVFWTPESVRWLAVSGKVSHAKKVVAKIARINRRPCPDTSAVDEIALEEKTKMKGHKYTYLDLFRIPSLRPLTIKFTLMWTLITYMYYVLNFSVSALSGDFYINFLISAALEFPGNIILLPIINRLGRRYSSLIFITIEVACCFLLVLMTFVTSGEDKDKSILCLALLCKTINMSSCSIVLIYSPELFPTVVRSLHYGFVNGVSRIGAILSPYLIPEDQNNLYICFIVIGIMSIMRFGIVFTLPETKAEILKDTAYTNTTEMKSMDDCDEEPI